jgi:CysZ protein
MIPQDFNRKAFKMNTSKISLIKTGLKAYLKAIRLIWTNHLVRYLLLPVILNIVVVTALIFSGIGVGEWINSTIEQSVENVNGWIRAAMIGIKIILPIIFFALFIFIGGTIVIILMSPIYTLLSEKTETILTGKEFPFDLKQTLKDVWRAIRIAIRNTIKQLSLIVLCLLFNFIPVVGSVISLILIFIINAYYFGCGFMDYTYERWRMSPKESRNEIHKLKYITFAIGAVYSLPFYLFCGAFIAAFIGGVSTVAATITQLELSSKPLGKPNEIKTSAT